MTVLDVMLDEELQPNARTIGAALRSELEELQARHPMIGAVHGMGLYMGVELVRDRATREPAVAETVAICERMLELGVVVQPTGDRMNVLKIKPPMCLSASSRNLLRGHAGSGAPPRGGNPRNRVTRRVVAEATIRVRVGVSREEWTCSSESSASAT